MESFTSNISLGMGVTLTFTGTQAVSNDEMMFALYTS